MVQVALGLLWRQSLLLREGRSCIYLCGFRYISTDAECAPSLEALKARLDGALGSLIWWEGNHLTAGALELEDLF